MKTQSQATYQIVSQLAAAKQQL